METHTHKLTYVTYTNIDELEEASQRLLKLAIEVSKDAYAPYSDFKVGAAVLLENGQVIKGSNQENGAFPSGLCAERVSLFSASVNFPGIKMKTIAIYAPQSLEGNQMISPCGGCRQVMSEYEQKQNSYLKVLLMNATGEIWQFEKVEDLLPFAFKFKLSKL